MDEVQLEHRLTAIESKVEMGFMQTTIAINGLTDRVGNQNGRVTKLEANEVHRDRSKRDREWLLPMLASLPPSALALIGIIILLAGR